MQLRRRATLVTCLGMKREIKRERERERERKRERKTAFHELISHLRRERSVGAIEPRTCKKRRMRRRRKRRRRRKVGVKIIRALRGKRRAKVVAFRISRRARVIVRAERPSCMLLLFHESRGRLWERSPL